MESSRCDVRVLGPLRVRVDGDEVQLGGPRPRLLLALLAVAGGRSVSMGRLIDDLYGEEPPATARKSVQVHVSNLRRALDPVEAILTTPDGYRLDTGVVSVDALQFEQDVASAIELVATAPVRRAGHSPQHWTAGTAPRSATSAPSRGCGPRRPGWPSSACEPSRRGSTRCSGSAGTPRCWASWRC